MRFAMFLLAEYAGIVVLAALTDGAVPRRLARPVVGPARLAVDAAQDRSRWRSCVIWVRVAYPRLREDQLNALAWKVLVPARARRSSR